MPAETFVQVATDGTGKKIRNIALTEPQAVDASGNVQADLVRYQQIVGIVNARGDHPDITSLTDIRDVLLEINQTLHLILDQYE